jgi:hypothetical protein
LPHLQNDKQQDGRSKNVGLRFLRPMITKGFVGQVTFGAAVNCNFLTKYIKNNNPFKLIKHEAMVIRSVSLLYFRSHTNAVP